MLNCRNISAAQIGRPMTGAKPRKALSLGLWGLEVADLRIHDE